MSYPGRYPRCFKRSKLGAWKRALNTVEKSAEGILDGSHRRRPERWKTKDHEMSNGTASDPQRKLAAAMPPDEPVAGSPRQPESIPPSTLLAQVLDRENLRRAWKQVRRNKGAA